MSRGISLSGLAITVALAATLSGCGGGGGVALGRTTPVAVAAPLAGGSVALTIKNFRFSPDPLRVKLGQRITVTNKDKAVHTITADNKSFDSKNLAKGQSYTFRPRKPGKYTYVCDIHQYMTGTIIVSR